MHLERAVGCGERGELLESVGGERVAQRCRYALSARVRDEADELCEHGGADARGERGDVLPGRQGPTGARDVHGIVESSLLVEGELAPVELLGAEHAGSARGEGVGAPARAAHPTVTEHVDGDPAVDDGDEVGVRQAVEDGAGPGPSTQETMMS